MKYITQTDKILINSQHPHVELSAEIDPTIEDIFISHLEVTPEHRNEGHGKRVINEIEELAQQELGTPVTITIRIGTDGSVKEFLQRAGFSGISVEENGTQLQASKYITE